MKRILLLALLLLVQISGLEAKPPIAPPKKQDVPALAPTAGSPSSGWLHWLMEQDGGSGAATAPVMEVLQNLTTGPIVALKPTDPTDAAIVARISEVLDGLLPRLNRAEGHVRSAPNLSSVPGIVEEELRAALVSSPGLESTVSARGEEALGAAGAAVYPSLRVTDAKSGHTYFLGVGYALADRAATVPPTLEIDPRSTARRIEAGGTPLLIVLEHNGKSGNQLAFLNWQLVDPQNARVRLRVSFSAGPNDFSLPGSAVNDGRKGRD